MIIEKKEEKLDLSEVYYDLDHPHVIRSKKENILLHRFAQLMRGKPSFAHHVHTIWSKIIR